MSETGRQTRSQTRKRKAPVELPNPVDIDDDSDISDNSDNALRRENESIRFDAVRVPAIRQIPPPKDSWFLRLQRFVEKSYSTMVDFLANQHPFIKLMVFVTTMILIYMSTNHFLGKDGAITPKESEFTRKQFDKSFRTLKNHFELQYDDTIDSLHLALTRVFDVREPGDPSSIIVLIPPQLSASSFPSCFTNVFGQLLNRANQRDVSIPPKVLDVAAFGDTPSAKIARDLKAYFDDGGASVIVRGITQLTLIDYFHLFHTFSDTTHAPVKRAAFLFLVDIPTHLYDEQETTNADWKTSESKLASLGNKILVEAWENSELGEDYVYALLARIGSWGTILLNDGDSCNENTMNRKVMAEL